VAPAERSATTPFAASLPTTVLQYALASSAADEEWVRAGALEAYTEQYTDGGSGSLTLRAGQFEQVDEARAFAATLVAGLPAGATPAAGSTPTAGPGLPQSGDVLAGGSPVGTFTVADAGDGTGVAVWTNGQTVLRLQGPVADVLDAYRAFPL
jgi:hypothetical protein